MSKIAPQVKAERQSAAEADTASTGVVLRFRSAASRAKRGSAERPVANHASVSTRAENAEQIAQKLAARRGPAVEPNGEASESAAPPLAPPADQSSDTETSTAPHLVSHARSGLRFINAPDPNRTDAEQAASSTIDGVPAGESPVRAYGDIPQPTQQTHRLNEPAIAGLRAAAFQEVDPNVPPGSHYDRWQWNALDRPGWVTIELHVDPQQYPDMTDPITGRPR